MGTTYLRVRFKPEGGRAQSVILRDAAERTSGMLGHVLVGVEVDREGDEVASGGATERIRVISMPLVRKRTPLVVDNLTGMLVEPQERMRPEPGQSFCDLGIHRQCDGLTEGSGERGPCGCTCHEPAGPAGQDSAAS